MSSQLHNTHPQPQPIAFANQPIEQEPVQPSMERFPSTSEFNEPLPQNYSVASLNYGDQQIQQPAQPALSGKSLHQASLKELEKQQEQQQVQQLQKVRTGNNQIDQDQILRMFQQEEEKKRNRKEQFIKNNQKKKPTSNLQTVPGKGDKKTTSSILSSKKQQSLDDIVGSKKRDQNDDSLGALHRATSFKDTARTSTTASQHSLISASQPIRDLVMQYKIQYRSSVFDPDWQKQRYRLREQFFEQLCIGIEEIKQKVQPSQQQQQVLDKVRQINESVTKQAYDFGIFKYCRSIVTEVDIELFVHFHQRSKQPLSKDYKGQYKFLIANLKDPQNCELRKKLLTHQFTADMIKVANQIQFFTDAKRTQIKEKQAKLLKQFSADRDIIMLKPEFQHQKEEQRLAEHIKYDSSGMADRKGSHALNQAQPQVHSQKSLHEQQNPQQPFSISSLLTINKFLDESTLTQLEELLSDNQLLKMRKRLQQDLRGECKQRMIKKFETQFGFIE